MIRALEPLRFDGQLCGRQIETSSLPPPARGESIVIEYYDERAAVELEVGRRDQALSARTGMALDWSEDEIVGVATIKAELSEGSRFGLQADVPQGWTFDSVMTDPPEALADWNRQVSGGPIDRLDFRLALGLTKARPITLILNGRMVRAPVNERLNLRELEMARMRDVDRDETLIGIRASGSYRLRLEDADEVLRLDPGEIGKDWADTLGGVNFDLFFQPAPAAEDAVITLVPQKPRYRAEVDVEIAASSGGFWQATALRCTPETARPVSQVSVYWPATNDGPPLWSLSDDPDPAALTATLAASPPMGSGLPADGHWWDLTLRQPRLEPFEIQMRRSWLPPSADAVPSGETSAPGQVPGAAVEGSGAPGFTATSAANDDNVGLRVYVPILPEATTQRGRLLARTVGPVEVDATPHGMRPMNTGAGRGLLPGVPRAAFATPETERFEVPVSAYVTLKPLRAARLQGALCWESVLDSRYDGGSRARHFATFRIENSSRDRLIVTLPVDSELHAVTLDRAPLPPTLGAGSFEVELPEGKRFFTLKVHFSTPVAANGLWTRVVPAWPRLSIPELDHRLTVWTPVGTGAAPLTGDDGAGAALSWPQRLFGFVARDPRQRPFDPSRREDWLRLVGRDSARETSRHLAERVLAELGPNRPASDVTMEWGDWLTHWEEEARVSGKVLLVDARALARRGISPSARMTLEMNSDRDAVDPWTVLAQSSGIVLGTRSEWGAWFGQTTGKLDATILETPSGIANQEISQAFADGAAGRFQRASAWVSRPAEPWTASVEGWNDPAFADPLLAIGWQATRIAPAASPDLTLLIVKQNSLTALAWTSFVACLALGWAFALRQLSRLLAALGLAAAVALCVDPVWSPMASAAVLGFMLAFGSAVWVRWPRYWPTSGGSTITRASGTKAAVAPSEKSKRGSGAKLAPTLLGVTLFALGLLTLADPSRGAEDSSKANPRAGDFRVLIPVDASGRPVPGAPYQVPLELYRELRARFDRIVGLPREWLIRSATYRGALTRDATTQAPIIHGLQATFQLRTFGAATRVRLPLASRATAENRHEVMLDGRPTDATFDAALKELTFEVPEPGQYRLDVELAPQIVSQDGAMGFDAPMPPAPTSSLELTLPLRAPSIDVPSARGPNEFDVAGQTMRVALGPPKNLSARWREDDPASGTGPEIRVDQLHWLKLQPGLAQWDAQLRYRITGGSVRRLYVAVDPRLRPVREWQTPGQKQVVDAARRDLPGHPRTYVIQFAKPVTGNITIEATFNQEGSTGVGITRLARIEPLWVDVQRSSVGVSLDPFLEVLESRGTEISAAEFTTAWGGADQKAKVYQAFDLLSSGDARWSVTTRPKEPLKTVDQVLSLGVGRQAADVRFEATITTRDAPSFQHRLRVPADVRVRQVSLTEDGLPRPARWSQGPNGTLTVFLESPAGKQKVILEGRMSVSARGELALPTIQVEQGKVQRSRVQIFRRPEVLIDIPDALPANEQRLDDLGRLVAIQERPTEGASAANPAPLIVRPNRGTIVGEQAITVARQDGKWFAELELQIREVRDGVVDALRFDVPSTWTGPFEMSPQMTASLLPAAPGEDTRTLVLRPRGAITGAFRATLRGPLSSGGNRRLTVPNAKLAHAAKLDRFVILPLRAEGQRATWEVDGLTPGKVPTDFKSLVGKASEVYVARGEVYHAALENLEARSRTPQARVADYFLRGDATGCSGVLALDVDLAGASELTLAFPVGCRPLEFQVGGSTAEAWTVPAPVAMDAEPADSSTKDARPTRSLDSAGTTYWRVRIGSAGLPQRVEVVFELAPVDVPNEAPRRTWPSARSPNVTPVVPYAVGLPVRRLIGSALFEGVESMPGRDSQIASAACRLTRLEGLVGTLEEAANQAADEPLDELRAWYPPFHARLHEGLAALRAAPDAWPKGAVQALLKRLEAQQQIWAQLTGELPSARGTREPPRDHSASAAWLLADDIALATHWSVTNGPPAETSFRAWTRETWPVWTAPRFETQTRWALAFVVAVFSLALTQGRGLRSGLGVIRQWPQAIFCLVGLAWWLWLEPSPAGWLLIAIGLLLSVPNRRAGTDRDSPSTVMRPLSGSKS